jgi:hypothetical protein
MIGKKITYMSVDEELFKAVIYSLLLPIWENSFFFAQIESNMKETTNT